MTGTLFVAATPIGNLDDAPPRLRQVLRDVDIIVTEDTRSTRRLLAALGVERGGRPLVSCFDANEAARATEVAARLREGRNVALISEAGTPGVSDPGFRVVRAAIAAGARVVPVPGPSAVVAALSACGLPTDRFAFLGFLPRQAGARRRLLASVRSLPFTLVFYESPLRAAATIADLRETLGDRPAVVARELTKEHEEFVRETLGELGARYAKSRPLGEVTILVAGEHERTDPRDGPVPDDELRTRALGRLAEGISARDVAAELADVSGRPRRQMYALVLEATRQQR